MDVPPISVVMPVRNVPAAYVDAAIGSILAQTAPHFEFIIIDDGSTDDTGPRIGRWAERDRRIRLLQSDCPGVAGALNAGLKVAAGEFIARMDADDVALPERFALQLDFLSRHPDCVCLGSDVLLIDPEGAPLTRIWQETEHGRIEARLLEGVGGSLCHPTVLMRRWALDRVGGYESRFDCSQDLDLFLRLAEVGRLANLPRVLLQYRQHFQSVSLRRHERQWEYKRLITDRARARRGLKPLALPARVAPPSVGIVHGRWARLAFRAGYWATGGKHLGRALARLPMEAPTWLAFGWRYLRRWLAERWSGRRSLTRPNFRGAFVGAGFSLRRRPLPQAKACGYRQLKTLASLGEPARRLTGRTRAAPRLSVVMPIRDVPSRYLDRALLSVLAQTESSFEMVIVDDGSGPACARRLDAWRQRDPRIRLIRSPRQGVTAALNLGLGLARGEFIARMDGDDVAEPTRFARQLAFLDRRPECVCVGTDLLLIDPDGRPLARLRQLVDHEAIVRAMLGGSDGVIGHPSAMMRAAAVRRLGGYDASYPHSQDLELFLRLAEVGQLANLPLPLLRYRQHLGAVSIVKLAMQWQCKARIVNRARARRGLAPIEFPAPPCAASAAGLTYLRWARLAWQGGQWAGVLRYGTAALARWPRESADWWNFLVASSSGDPRREAAAA